MASLSSENVGFLPIDQEFGEQEWKEWIENALYGSKNGMENFIEAAMEIMFQYSDSHILDSAKNDKALRICRLLRYNIKLMEEMKK